jgi:hypothetical protein
MNGANSLSLLILLGAVMEIPWRATWQRQIGYTPTPPANEAGLRSPRQ